MKNSYIYCPYDGEKLIITNNEKAKCPSCHFVDYQDPKPCVAIFITQDNKVLLARRAIEPSKGMWDIPGGFVESGESAEQAVVREALEETNLKVQVTKFLGSQPDVYGDEGKYTLNLCFLAKVLSGEIKPLSDVDLLKWFRIDELPDTMAFYHQKEFINLLRKKLI